MFRGASDYPHFARIITASSNGEGDDRVETPRGIASGYDHLERCDPARDLLVAEVDGGPSATAASGGIRRPTARSSTSTSASSTRPSAVAGSARRSSRGTRRDFARSPPTTTSPEKLFEAWANDRNVGRDRADPRRRLRAGHVHGRDGAAVRRRSPRPSAPGRARDPARARGGHARDLGGRHARRSATTGATSSRREAGYSGSSRSRTTTSRSGRSPGTTRASPAR